ncbi:Uma2 family endonuclease [Streptomyces rimosus]|uniref:Uma2 family endonuclease n=1 Tax=Streptomyces rimosus TaxID=1927 RepID=UPI00067E22EE|nr:Uma2 family endonuclease [Streptomyces rimosus]
MVVWDELTRFRREAKWPEGCKVQIVGGLVVVEPPPDSAHNDTVDELQRLLYTVIPRDWGIYQALELTLAGARGLFVPDVSVAPKKRCAADVPRLVAEVTSWSGANHDRVEKLHAYAATGVPLYLLLDPWHSGRPTATLYGEPEGGSYRVLEMVKYGDELRLPAPFDVTVDTSLFPVG